jgi:hypothetical protein
MMLPIGVEPHCARNRIVSWLLISALLISAPTASGTTYISAEPVPNRDIVGEENLARIRGIGYANLERWSQRLLEECGVVDNVIDVLTIHGAISSVTAANTRFVVAAGGFEGATSPSFVFTIQDSGPDGVSEADVDVLDNALGYVLNQGATVHFSTDNKKAYAFFLNYAVVTFAGLLTGGDARAFFDDLGTIDEALWSGQFAGFTQIDFEGSSTNNSMLFLQPAVSKHRFISGLSEAASTDTRATYSPLKVNGKPTTSAAGVTFPGNDWLAFPDGDGYLVNVGDSSQLLSELAVLRQQHLTAAANLLAAIDGGNVETYLSSQFSCPN